MADNFVVRELGIDGLVLIQRKPLADSRGYFERLYCADEFSPLGVEKPIVQINHSYTRLRGAVRGMHFQNSPHSEVKIVSCLRGEVFDVAIDLRFGSSTFLHWHGEILSAENQRSLLIPEGFAHGFQTLCDDSELLYLHTVKYTPGSEGGVHPQDERIAVEWPLTITDISDRDRSHPKLSEQFLGLK